MKIVACAQCGSIELEQHGGYMVCPYCGTRYKMDADDFTKKESNISLDADVRRLLEKCKTDPKRASLYAGLVLDIDPTNQEALRYL